MTEPLATFRSPDPGSPEYVGPCAKCAGEAARRHVLDARDYLTDGASFPAEAVRDFLERFGPVWDDMMRWTGERAEIEAMRQDHDACYEHRPTKEDSGE